MNEIIPDIIPEEKKPLDGFDEIDEDEIDWTEEDEEN